MLRIEIKDPTAKTRSGTSGRTGKAYSMREQTAWVHMGKAYPVETRITLGDEQEAFAVGEYTLTPECFRLNRYGDLECDLRFMRSTSAAKPAAVGGVVR